MPSRGTTTTFEFTVDGGPDESRRSCFTVVPRRGPTDPPTDDNTVAVALDRPAIHDPSIGYARRHVRQQTDRPPDARLDLRGRRRQRPANAPSWPPRPSRSPTSSCRCAKAARRRRSPRTRPPWSGSTPRVQIAGGARPGHRPRPAALRRRCWPRRWSRPRRPGTGSGRSTTRPQRTQQQLHFFKNVSLFGGLVIAAGRHRRQAGRGLAGPPRGQGRTPRGRHLGARPPAGRPSWRAASC